MEILSDEFTTAVGYTLDAHRLQPRKGTDIPYAAHLLAVASIVLEDGGDETTAIVALLHDVVEDQDPDGRRLADIRSRFGDTVADAVQECSAESKVDDPGWEVRKQRYVDHMRAASPIALRVSLADKVHNLRCIVEDYRRSGAALWERFNAPSPDRLVWYYHSLLEVYGEHAELLSRDRIHELQRLLGQLKTLLQRPNCPECGSGDVLPVITGRPLPEDMERADAGEVVLSGCIVEEDTPDWSCRRCDAEWRDRAIER